MKWITRCLWARAQKKCDDNEERPRAHDSNLPRPGDSCAAGSSVGGLWAFVINEEDVVFKNENNIERRRAIQCENGCTRDRVGAEIDRVERDRVFVTSRNDRAAR